MNKYIDKFTDNIQKQLNQWLSSNREIENKELYRFLHSVAGTAPTLGLTDIGKIARERMENIVEEDDKLWTQHEIEDFLFALNGLCDNGRIPNNDKRKISQSNNISGNEPVIMIIDDDTSILMYLKDELQKEGWFVIAVADPIKAISSFYDLQPDCVIIDVHMNEKNGFEVLSFLKQKLKQQFLPTIMMSVDTRKEVRIKSYEMGADEFISKPIDIDELSVRIKRHLERKELIEKLLLVDELTRVYNRKYLQKIYEQFNAELSRRKESFCVAILDLDHFKHINDKFGHLTGDVVLKEFAAFLNEHLRDGDIIVRYGGEEFVLLLKQITLDEANIVLKRILKEFSLIKFEGKNETFTCTFSGGLVEINIPGQPLTKWVEMADSALYKAKESGRNQINLGNQLSVINHRKLIKIGIVDDDPIILSMLNDLLEKIAEDSGFEFDIQLFRDGQAFFSNDWYKSTENQYLIILDGIMPKMDGIEVLQQLRGLSRNDRFTVIMLTSRKGERDISRALKLGADDYITKPFKLLELESRIRHLLKRVK